MRFVYAVILVFATAGPSLGQDRLQLSIGKQAPGVPVQRK
jgi:hypothetical protein